MGLWDVIKGEFIEVISWLDDSGDTMVWRFPDQDHAIKMGAKLTVREGQTAVFVNEGQIADVFPPGMYTLSTQNLPVLTKLRSWKYGFDSPFKAEVYFVSSRTFVDLKWGTQNPIMMRDPQFDVVRLRAFGSYNIKVSDPRAFMTEIVGVQGCYTTEEIEGQLRSMAVSSFSALLGESGIAALDLAAKYRTLGEKLRVEMASDFEKYGLSLTRFIIENISVPPEVEKMLDTRSQMAIAGDDGRFMRFQTAQAITDAAKSGGAAGDFLGMGAGVAMGQQMAASMAGAASSQPQAQGQSPSPSQGPGKEKFCSACGNKTTPGAKFCSDCGAKLESGCSKCGHPRSPGDKFCKECGQKLD